MWWLKKISNKLMQMGIFLLAFIYHFFLYLILTNIVFVLFSLMNLECALWVTMEIWILLYIKLLSSFPYFFFRTLSIQSAYIYIYINGNKLHNQTNFKTARLYRAYWALQTTLKATTRRNIYQRCRRKRRKEKRKQKA
jgi:hypothetical protein